VEADFSAGTVSSDAGALLLRQAERKIGLIGLLAGFFYETAGVVKVFVFVFAFVFSLLAFLFLRLLLLLFLPFLVSRIHLGLLYALAGSRSGLGA
jgi:hypothetical protein